MFRGGTSERPQLLLRVAWMELGALLQGMPKDFAMCTRRRFPLIFNSDFGSSHYPSRLSAVVEVYIKFVNKQLGSVYLNANLRKVYPFLSFGSKISVEGNPNCTS